VKTVQRWTLQGSERDLILGKTAAKILKI
jgi:hypothetical protein